jgi:hypothetical protein
MVSELAHMLAELIENALAFSPPDLEVEIYGRKLGPKYMLAVVDHGVGMSREQLAKANARLRGEEDFVVAPTRFLGHYVVGQLAQRLGIEVELTVSPVNGIVARLLLPADVLATDVEPEAPKPPIAEVTPEAEQEHVLWPVTQGMLPAEPVFVPSQEPMPWVRTPPEPALVAAAVSTAPADEPRQPERTRNGLVKRAKRAGADAKPARPSPTRPAPPPAELRSPEDVRSMLSTFRSGHQRGTADQADPADHADREESR